MISIERDGAATEDSSPSTKNFGFLHDFSNSRYRLPAIDVREGAPIKHLLHIAAAS